MQSINATNGIMEGLRRESKWAVKKTSRNQQKNKQKNYAILGQSCHDYRDFSVSLLCNTHTHTLRH